MRNGKKRRRVLLPVLCALWIGSAALPAKAYTEEEKQMVKDALAAYGYAPTWDGLNQAYSDYLEGKLDLSAYGIAPVQPQTEPVAQQDPQAEPQTDSQTEPQTEQAEETAGETGTLTKDSGGEKASEGGENSLESQETGTVRELVLGTAVEMEGYAEVTLKEVSFGSQVYPPVTNGDYTTYRCHGDQMQYLDLVFLVKNLTQEEILASDFMTITVKDGSREYPGEMNLCEIGNGTDLSADVRIYPMMENRLHCVAAVPEAWESFWVDVQIHGEVCRFFFEKDGRLIEEEELVEQVPVTDEKTAEVTLNGMEKIRTEEGKTYLRASLTIRNLQSYESELSWMCGGMVFLEGTRCPGYLSPEGDEIGLPGNAGIKSGETAEVYLMVPLPEEAAEESETSEEKRTEGEKEETEEQKMELMLYLGGKWYGCPVGEEGILS